MADDFTFTFDTNPFEQAIKQITDGFDTLKSTLSNFGKETQSGAENFVRTQGDTLKTTSTKIKKHTEANIVNFKENASNMIGALTKRVAILAAAFFSIRKALTYIPEVGRAFKHAGDIAMRSFLWPLRKMLIPMLNDMLAWVREHRIMFVRWGAMLANAFRVVVNIIKSVIGLARTLVQSFMSRFEELFGKTAVKLSDVFNILMFKFTVFIEYLVAILSPLAKIIGEVFAEILKLLSEFGEGFLAGFGPVGDYVQEVVDHFGRLADLIGEIVSDGDGMNNVFRQLGYILGVTIKTALMSLVQLIDWFITGLHQAVIGIKMVSAAWDSKWDEYERLEKKYDKIGAEGHERMKKRWSEFWENAKKGASESFGTKPGPALSPLPGSSPKTTNINNKVDIAPITLNVTEGSAKVAGEQFVEGMTGNLKDGLKKAVNDASVGVASEPYWGLQP